MPTVRTQSSFLNLEVERCQLLLGLVLCGRGPDLARSEKGGLPIRLLSFDIQAARYAVSVEPQVAVD